MHSKIWGGRVCVAIVNVLCVGIGIEKNSANFRDRTWQEIGGVDVKE